MNQILTEEQKKEQQQQELSDMLIYEKSEEKSLSPLANGECAVCKRKGFPIFLVRKTILPKGYDKKKNYWSNGMISLGDREPKEDEAPLQTHEYVYRTLRKGYVYILAKKLSGGYDPIGYEVTPSGVLRHKTRYDMKERNIKEIPESCSIDAHRIPGYFINIDTTVYSDIAYVAYTRRAWSDSAVNTYLDMAENDPSNIKLTRFSKITLSADGLSNSTKLSLDGRSFSFNKLFESSGPRLLEFELANDRVYCQNKLSAKLPETSEVINTKEFNEALSRKLFMTAHPFNSFIIKQEPAPKTESSTLTSPTVLDSTPQESKLNPGLQQIHGHYTELQGSSVSRLTGKQKGKDQSESVVISVSALVLEDPFGLAEELSYQRQITIGPILELIFNAEQKYTIQMQKQYQHLFNSTESIKEQFKEIEKAYRKDEKHQEESLILFDEKYGKTYPVKPKLDKHAEDKPDLSKNPINDDFLNEKYYSSYVNLTSSGISYRYFNEKLMHIRKHKSYIDGFYTELAERFRETGDRVMYDYHYFSTGIGDSATVEVPFVLTSRFLASGYKEVVMNQQEKDEILKIEREQYSSAQRTYFDVRKFIVPNTAKEEREKKLKKEIEKYDCNLAKYRVAQFMSEEEKTYNELISSVKLNSIDYFNFTTWLLGYSEDGKVSKYTPQNIKSFNKVAFWKIECDTNSSNNHIGYLADFCNMIDTFSLGNIKLDYQYGLWDILLKDQNTLYFHLINGGAENNAFSFWTSLLEVRKAIDVEISEQKQCTAEKGEISPKSDDVVNYEERAKEAIIKLIEDHKQELDSLFFLEKGVHILNLYQILLSRVTNAIVQRDKDTSLINDKLIESHFIDASMVIAGVVGKVCSFEVKASEARDVIRRLGISATIFAVDYPKDVDSRFDTPLVTGTFLLDQDPPVMITVFQMAEDTFELSKRLGELFTAPWDEVMKSNTQGIVLKLKEIWSGTTSSSSIKLVSSDSVALLLNAFGAYSHMMQVSHNYKILDRLGIGQTQQDELKMAILKNQIQFITKSIIVLSDICEKLKVDSLIASFFSSSVAVRTLTNNIFKSLSSASTVLGVVGPIMTFWDGAMFLVKGYTTDNLPSYLRNQYYICGALLIVSTLIAMAKLAGLLTSLGLFGVAIAIIGMIIGIAVTVYSLIYKDESDEWDRMQTWFNRCLLGVWGHRDKGLPYPPTFEAMALASNDYLVARSMIDCNIQLNQESYYIKELDSSSYDEWGRNTATEFIRGLYLYLDLPGFSKQSIYECSIRLQQKKSAARTSLNISATTGKKYPIIEVGKQEQIEAWGVSKHSIFARRDVNKLLPIVDKTELGESSKVGLIEQIGVDPDAIKNGNSPFYLIRYKLGEFSYAGTTISCKLFYYPNGKQTGDDKVLPLILDYEYGSK